MSNQEITYKMAGVDIAAGNEAVRRIKNQVKSTFTPNILSEIGGFAALIDLKNIVAAYEHPVLVQSIDGVGTKTVIAKMLQKYDTLGIDLLSSSCNDILVVGAKPLTLLDYIASDRLDPDIIEQLVAGMVKACKANDVALVGGETAEMPKIYVTGEHDLVGIVTGVVDKAKIINGSQIQPGDKILGFAASGLHTNGYSLARKLFFEIGNYKIDSQVPELANKSIGEVLLIPHINYTNPILGLLQANIALKGMAHITGGGLLENVPRVLPADCTAEIKLNSWNIPPVFNLMQQLGNLSLTEMYRTLNMGVGFVVIADRENAAAISQKIKTDYPEFQLSEIGDIIRGTKEVKLI
jgi:phosphoribosylformylglycinamidine cyclo-ligase